jgi:DNA-binding NtrC family response regulator
MTAAHTGKQVLVVDDDRAVLRLLSQWLTGAGYAVVACDRFETAKQHLAEAPPDILLADVRLGAFNGLQLVILAKEQAPGIVAIAMSAFDDPMLRRDAAQCGAGYLAKPFTQLQVLASLGEVSQSKAADGAAESSR